MGRHDLLTRLYDEGINDFRSWTVDELGPELRFPVFLRWANAHDGSIGTPIANRKVLDQRLDAIRREHHRRWRWTRDQLLIVERIDARSPDGLFRKYSVARIGDAYIPRHMVVSGYWVTKRPAVVTPELVAEEEAFLADPPDLELMKQVFDLAGVEFGRIDWGYVNGRPQIWEINTNPMLAPSHTPHPLREPGQRRQTALTQRALTAHVPTPGPPRERGLVAAPERWAWHAMNRGSRRFDQRRR